MDDIKEAVGLRCKHKWVRLHAIPGGKIVRRCSKCDLRETAFDPEQGRERERTADLEAGRGFRRIMRNGQGGWI